MISIHNDFFHFHNIPKPTLHFGSHLLLSSGETTNPKKELFKISCFLRLVVLLKDTIRYIPKRCVCFLILAMINNVFVNTGYITYEKNIVKDLYVIKLTYVEQVEVHFDYVRGNTKA
jgi:hypothetical protein